MFAFKKLKPSNATGTMPGRAREARGLLVQRFSRTAIVGACVVLISFLPAMTLPGLAVVSRQSESNALVNLVWGLAPFLLLFGLPGALGATILGWLAVSQSAARRENFTAYGWRCSMVCCSRCWRWMR